MIINTSKPIDKWDEFSFDELIKMIDFEKDEFLRNMYHRYAMIKLFYTNQE